jgi:hypothetical protein
VAGNWGEGGVGGGRLGGGVEGSPGLLQLPMSAGPAPFTSSSSITKEAAEKIARKLAENWRIGEHATRDLGPGTVYADQVLSSS